MKILVRMISKEQADDNSLDGQLSTRRRCRVLRFGFAETTGLLPECANAESLVTPAAGSPSAELTVKRRCTSVNRVHVAALGIWVYAGPQSHETRSLRSCKPAEGRWEAALRQLSVDWSVEGERWMTFWMMVPFSIRTRRFVRVDQTLLRMGCFFLLSL